MSYRNQDAMGQRQGIAVVAILSVMLVGSSIVIANQPPGTPEPNCERKIAGAPTADRKHLKTACDRKRARDLVVGMILLG
jgi:hypothetical protein